MRPTTALLAFCILAAAPGGAFAQQPDSGWGKPSDLKPLLPPVLPPVIPPNSLLTTGPALGDGLSPYASGPLNDPSRSQATPGLRLTIPTH